MDWNSKWYTIIHFHYRILIGFLKKFPTNSTVIETLMLIFKAVNTTTLRAHLKYDCMNTAYFWRVLVNK